MGLVDYGSDSDSDSEPVQQPVAPTPAPAAASSTTKKPFQKLIDRSGSGSGKIIVNLGNAGTDPESNLTEEEPPAKRAKTAGAGTSRFSSFGSFLPAPKKTAPVASTSSTSASVDNNSNKPKPLVNLKTGAEPAFSRTRNDDGEDGTEASESTSGSGFSSGLNLPAPKKTPAGPSIPEGQKSEEEVKLVGKPLMFKPLSVARKPQKKKVAAPKAPAAQTTTTVPGPSAQDNVVIAQPAALKRKQVSLFSMEEEEATPAATATTPATGAYEPLFSAPEPSTSYEHHDDDVTGDYDSHSAPSYNSAPSNASHQQSLSTIADELALNETARRELFGRQRGGKNRDAFEIPDGAKIVNFNMEKEYEHNNALRASGEQVYNPVRAIAPGKHSLRQMVNMAQANQSALEDSWAQGRNNRKDAAGKYGWK